MKKRKIGLFWISLVVPCLICSSQENAIDSTMTLPSDSSALIKDTSTTVLRDTLVQEKKPYVVDSTKIKDMGVAVSPSTMRFRVKPGTSETKYLTITNDTYKPQSFKLTFADFEMNNSGQVHHLPIGNNANEFGLSKWITAAPNYVEVMPGEKKKIAVEVNLPDMDDAYKAAWCILMVDQAKEKDFILPPSAKDGNISMGVIPVFGFGVYIYQNPPNVKLNKVEIISFTFNYDNKNRYVHLRAKNIGDGIGFCKSYIEVSNLNTGYNDRLALKQFNVLPGQEREFEFMLPGNLPKGNYSILGVLDFGSEEELEAAEMEIVVE